MRLCWPALALVAAALAGCSSSAASQQTTVVLVSPVTSSGVAVSGYRAVGHAANASCEPGSEAIGQGYRCFAGNRVYDPCWAERAGPPTVLCMTDPWLHTDVRLTVSAPLSAIPNEGGMGEPWGVQLESGLRCLLVQGAHPIFDDRVLDYICGQNLGLLRAIDKNSQPWTDQSVLIAKSGQMSSGQTQKILIAWFGKPDRFR